MVYSKANEAVSPSGDKSYTAHFEVESPLGSYEKSDEFFLSTRQIEDNGLMDHTTKIEQNIDILSFFCRH